MNTPKLILSVALIPLLLATAGYVKYMVKEWKTKPAEKVDTTPPDWFFRLTLLGMSIGLVGAVWVFVMNIIS